MEKLTREQLIEASAKRVSDAFKENPDLDLNELMNKAANELNDLLAEFHINDPENEEYKARGMKRTKAIIKSFLEDYDIEDIFVLGRIKKQPNGNYECIGICQGEKIKVISMLASIIHASKIPMSTLAKAVEFEERNDSGNKRHEEYEFIQRTKD